MVSIHPIYQTLGLDNLQRQRAYAERCREDLPEDLVADLMACTSSAVPLGDDQFKKRIEQQLGVEFGYTRRGRPPKLKAYVPQHNIAL